MSKTTITGQFSYMSNTSRLMRQALHSKDKV